MSGVSIVATAPADDGARQKLELRRAAEAFEALFMQTLVQRMREAQLDGGFFGSGSGSKIYEGMFESFISQELSSGSPLGIADLLEAQWAGELGTGRNETVDRALTRVRSLTAARSYETILPESPFRAPVPEPGPGNGFGYRDDPIDGTRRFHGGVDLAAPSGTTVRAAAAGRVVRVDGHTGYGLQVVLEHEGGWQTRYAHLSGSDVRVGQSLERGRPLGQVGTTGRSTGPHLHFEVIRDGVKQDPARALIGPVRPQVLGPAADHY